MSRNITDVHDLEFDRHRTLCWWTGRLGNAQLGEYTGQTERDVRYILSSDYFKSAIEGGGRGSKHKRRISHQARNAVAIVSALRNAGYSVEAATSILDALPVIASQPTQVIDFSPTPFDSVGTNYFHNISLAEELPNENWLSSDMVPRHVFIRHCRPIVREGTRTPVSVGDIAWLPDWAETQLGGLPDGYESLGFQIYRPEIDPLGTMEFGNKSPDADDLLDHHLYIVDGRWIFLRHSDPDPFHYLVDLWQHTELQLPRRYQREDVTNSYTAFAEIDPTTRVVNSIRGNAESEKLALRAWNEPETKLDVNTTVAVRRMKRAALGLVEELS